MTEPVLPLSPNITGLIRTLKEGERVQNYDHQNNRNESNAFPLSDSTTVRNSKEQIRRPVLQRA